VRERRAGTGSEGGTVSAGIVSVVCGFVCEREESRNGVRRGHSQRGGCKCGMWMCVCVREESRNGARRGHGQRGPTQLVLFTTSAVCARVGGMAARGVDFQESAGRREKPGCTRPRVSVSCVLCVRVCVCARTLTVQYSSHVLLG